MRRTDQLARGLVLSGAGHLIHNVQEFGLGVRAGVESLLPVGITVLLIPTVRRRTSRGVLLVTGTWAMIVLVVGVGSVFPLAVLPFEPEQSTAHDVTDVDASTETEGLVVRGAGQAGSTRDSGQWRGHGRAPRGLRPDSLPYTDRAGRWARGLRR